MFEPRDYQHGAINAAVDFFKSGERFNAFEILPTGSGKSVVIANIAKVLHSETLVFQPSKEILEQNYRKFISYGYRAAIYSASAGSKFLDKTTFATIGSVIRKKHLFRKYKNILIDECHLVNSSDGMYKEFIESIPGAKVLGLTATPYRLTSDFEGAQLKFLNRTRPRIFQECIYYIQNNVLFDAGHLAKLVYINKDVVDRTKLKMNASGTDFTDDSVRDYYRQINMSRIAVNEANALLQSRKNLLIFCTTISEANEIKSGIVGSVVLTSETSDAERSRILSQFKTGVIKCVINVGILTTGFDYPELETVLIIRSTMSLALYYQIVGRGMRPHPNKESCHIVDLGGNINLFGKIETMEIRKNERGLMSIWNNGRQLTDVTFSRN